MFYRSEFPGERKSPLQCFYFRGTEPRRPKTLQFSFYFTLSFTFPLHSAFYHFLISLLWLFISKCAPIPSSALRPHRLLGSRGVLRCHKWAVWVCVTSRRISGPHGDHFTLLLNTVLISSETNKLQWRDGTLCPRCPLSNAVCLDQGGLITSSSNNALSLAWFSHKTSFYPTLSRWWCRSHNWYRNFSFILSSTIIDEIT